jgi:hypothetical protein
MLVLSHPSFPDNLNDFQHRSLMRSEALKDEEIG